MASELSSLIDKQLRSYDDVEKGDYSKVRVLLVQHASKGLVMPLNAAPGTRVSSWCIRCAYVASNAPPSRTAKSFVSSWRDAA